MQEQENNTENWSEPLTHDNFKAATEKYSIGGLTQYNLGNKATITAAEFKASLSSMYRACRQRHIIAPIRELISEETGMLACKALIGRVCFGSLTS